MTKSSSFLQPAIPKFDGFYNHWSMLMENLLRSKEYWNLIEYGVIIAPPNATLEQHKLVNESKLRDLKVKNYLFQSIDRSIMEKIIVCDTSKDIWDSMRRKYQGSTKVKRAQLQILRRELEVLAMKDSESVNDYIGKTLAITNCMTSHGERLEQTIIVEKVMCSMTPKFNYVVCSIEESNDVTMLSVDELQSSLLVHEQRMHAQHSKEEEQALKVSQSGRGYGRSRGVRNGCRGPGGRGRGRQSKKFIECFKCRKIGYYQSECLTWEENDANYTEFDDSEKMLLMAKQEITNQAKDEVWFLDFVCSNHMV
ncbi:uncharacterized protein [Medicago truncatula]|uniref:uncharacterized protein n=1 Tax=Medicago truncatula TaxID=3880 RepID=UPI000D2F1F2D|nr:uncharacterized protein LOC112420041 [Medicago truncatula]